LNIYSPTVKFGRIGKWLSTTLEDFSTILFQKYSEGAKVEEFIIVMITCRNKLTQIKYSFHMCPDQMAQRLHNFYLTDYIDYFSDAETLE
jgi:hypothetical protein